MPTEKQWREAWNEFFLSTAAVVQAKLDLKGSRPTADMSAFIKFSTAKIVTELTSEKNWQHICEAIRRYSDDEHPLHADILYRELIALAAQNRSVSSLEKPSAKQLDEAAEDAETGKDSLENLLGRWLPDWVAKLLDLLNEILKFVRG